MRAGFLWLLVVSSCVATTPGQVAPGPTSPPPAETRVSYGEFVGTVDSKAFARLDQDKTGSVTAEEWAELDRTVQASEDFAALDTDHDEEVNVYEWQANLGRSGVALRLFRYLDVNRDDMVSTDELRRNALAAALFAITF